MVDSYSETRPIRVLLVDDHQLLTGALSQMLSREPDIIVAGVAGTVAEAKAMARERLDVVLMDYRLPDGTGAEVWAPEGEVEALRLGETRGCSMP